MNIKSSRSGQPTQKSVHGTMVRLLGGGHAVAAAAHSGNKSGPCGLRVGMVCGHYEGCNGRATHLHTIVNPCPWILGLAWIWAMRA
jgi:hypothetical protein